MKKEKFEIEETESKKNYIAPKLQQIGSIPTVTQHNHTGSGHDGGQGGTHKIS